MYNSIETYKKVIESFKNKSCIVTGGTGLIGRQLVDMLVNESKADVIVLSLDDVQPVAGAEYRKVDLCNYDEVVGNIFDGIDYVFHLAGIKGSIEVTKSRPATFFVPYLKFNTNVLEAARLCKTLKGLVYTSSIGAYSSAEVFREGENEDGAPMDTFPGWAKRMAELQIDAYRKEYGLKNFHVTRPCNVYGPGDNFDPENAMVIPSLMYKINEYKKSDQKTPIQIWGDGSAIRDFAYSRDVAVGVMHAMYYGTYVVNVQTGKYTNYINLGSGVGITIAELVETLHRVIGGFEYTFDTSKPSGFPKRIMSMEMAKKAIKFEPNTSLEQGLQITWDWFKENETEYLQKKNYFKD